ncbi:MAG TPA: hypothetical protein VF526_03205, partial [Solirubrobacteraceae bacterium]
GTHDRGGGRALAIRCDVTRAEDVKRTLDKTTETFGRLDVAFNLILPLEQVAEGYRAMDERRAIKTLLLP